MEWCRLGDAGCAAVCTALQRNPKGSVTELSLAHCELRDVAPLAELLRSTHSLTKLDLSGNLLDDKAVEILAAALHELEAMDREEEEKDVGDGGAAASPDVRRRSSTLKEL